MKCFSSVADEVNQIVKICRANHSRNFANEKHVDLIIPF